MDGLALLSVLAVLGVIGLLRDLLNDAVKGASRGRALAKRHLSRCYFPGDPNQAQAPVAVSKPRQGTFIVWYATRFGDLSPVAQGFIWMLYGFIWIPVLYYTTAVNERPEWFTPETGSFGVWYQHTFATLHPVSEALMWLCYGFLWIPVLYWQWKKRSTIASPKS